MHISCSHEHQERQQQQQQQQHDPGTSNGNSSSSMNSNHGPVAQSLQQWRDANSLPEAHPSWRVMVAGDASHQPDLNPSQGAPKGLVPAGDPDTWVVLGIESSCDDTAAAVIRGDGTILSHRIASQVRAGLSRAVMMVMPSPVVKALDGVRDTAFDSCRVAAVLTSNRG